MEIYRYKGSCQYSNTSLTQILLDNSAMIDAEDSEGNTPLHVKCYGETGQPPELESIELLLSHGADPAKRNQRVRDFTNVSELHELYIQTK